MHVDEFIDDQFGQHQYARWVLHYFRLPATLKMEFRQFMVQHRLFCDYEGKRYRVTGASRLGDVWLAEDYERDTGYDLRVDVTKCENWGASAHDEQRP